MPAMKFSKMEKEDVDNVLISGAISGHILEGCSHPAKDRKRSRRKGDATSK